MPFFQGFARLFGGSGVAERSKARKVQKIRDTEKAQNIFKSVTEVTRERCPSPPKVLTDPNEPLPRRARKRPEPDYGFSDEEIKQMELALLAPPVRHDPFDIAYDAPTIGMPEMEGVGKYRWCKNATHDHKIAVATRATSDLTPNMVEQVIESGAVDAGLIRGAVARTASPSAPYRLTKHASMERLPRSSFVEYTNDRGFVVQQGFSPSLTTPSWSVEKRIRMRNHRGSSGSMTSVGSDDQSMLRPQLVKDITMPTEIATSARLRAADFEQAIISHDEPVVAPGPKQRGRPTSRAEIVSVRDACSVIRGKNHTGRFEGSPGRQGGGEDEENDTKAVDESPESFEKVTRTGA